MKTARQECHHGWTFEFRKNVHMYYHNLLATKNGQTFDVPCEDTPYPFVAIWPYSLNLEPALNEDLLQGLRAWAEASGMCYRLYISREHYVGNDGSSKLP